MYPPKPELEHRGVARANRRVAATVERMGDGLYRATTLSAWSAGHHVFHLALACELALRNVTGLVTGRSPLARDPDPERSRPAEADDVLARGRIPRGAAEAPRMVTPPPKVDPAIVRELVESNARDIAAIEPMLGELEGATRVVPHQLLGGLTALEWLRFARLHSVHHLVIIRAIERAGG